jgi:hypothetical protein
MAMTTLTFLGTRHLAAFFTGFAAPSSNTAINNDDRISTTHDDNNITTSRMVLRLQELILLNKNDNDTPPDTNSSYKEIDLSMYDLRSEEVEAAMRDNNNTRGVYYTMSDSQYSRRYWRWLHLI